MKQAIVIGATSGIGLELARILCREGYRVGITGRRKDRLEALKDELGEGVVPHPMDVAKHAEARKVLRSMFEEMGEVTLLVMNAGISTKHNPGWEREQQIVDINVAGFVAMTALGLEYFLEKGRGHIVGVSSVAGLKGFGRVAAYSASKSFVNTYLQAMRQKVRAKKLQIAVTTVLPGYVDTEMTDGRQGMFWVSGAAKAAEQIFGAIRRRRSYVYITRRWRIAGWILKAIPDWLFMRLPM